MIYRSDEDSTFNHRYINASSRCNWDVVLPFGGLATVRRMGAWRKVSRGQRMRPKFKATDMSMIEIRDQVTKRGWKNFQSKVYVEDGKQELYIENL